MERARTVRRPHRIFRDRPATDTPASFRTRGTLPRTTAGRGGRAPAGNGPAGAAATPHPSPARPGMAGTAARDTGCSLPALRISSETALASVPADRPLQQRATESPVGLRRVTHFAKREMHAGPREARQRLNRQAREQHPEEAEPGEVLPRIS